MDTVILDDPHEIAVAAISLILTNVVVGFAKAQKHCDELKAEEGSTSLADLNTAFHNALMEEWDAEVREAPNFSSFLFVTAQIACASIPTALWECCLADYTKKLIEEGDKLGMTGEEIERSIVAAKAWVEDFRESGKGYLSAPVAGPAITHPTVSSGYLQ